MRWPLSLLPLFVALAGCGGSGREPTATGAFSITAPNGWRSLDQKSARTTHTSDPRLRAAVRTLTRPSTPVQLIAVAPARPNAFAANMNVIQTRIPGSLSFDALARNEARQIALATAVHGLQQQTVELPAGRGLRLSYRVQRRGFVRQYFVKHERDLYVLTYTAPLAAGRRYAAIFDRSAHTFTLR